MSAPKGAVQFILGNVLAQKIPSIHLGFGGIFLIIYSMPNKVSKLTSVSKHLVFIVMSLLFCWKIFEPFYIEIKAAKPFNYGTLCDGVIWLALYVYIAMNYYKSNKALPK